MTVALDFVLPPEAEASEPPEERGIPRDGVRMMVAYRSGRRVIDSSFALLPEFLGPDDLLVINTSGTLAAAVSGTDAATGAPVVVHLSTALSGERDGVQSWVVELRRPQGPSTKPWAAPGVDPLPGPPPRLVHLDGGGRLELIAPFRESLRLWTARLSVPSRLLGWLAEHGRPIRYGYVARDWPLSAYQTVYVTEPGSAEMPSAGRPFTAEMVTRLVAQGVGFAPVVLHTGVSSPEADEPPYPEPVRVPLSTARRVNATKETGGRVIAVGTSVVRALESAFSSTTGCVGALDGWADLVVTPQGGVKVVDGLLTGWHEPEASHLLMLEAIAGRSLLESTYTAGLARRYLWHEFGDLALFLP